MPMSDLEKNNIRILHILSLTDFKSNHNAYITLEFVFISAYEC